MHYKFPHLSLPRRRQLSSWRFRRQREFSAKEEPLRRRDDRDERDERDEHLHPPLHHILNVGESHNLGLLL